MDSKKVGITALVIILIGIIVTCIIFFFSPKEEITYKVTFENGEFSEVIEVKEDNTVERPSNPTREGYTFEGWYYNGMKFDFTTEITEDITLEARWTKDSVKKWVVTFDTNGADAIENLNVEDGKTIIDIPTPVREGYTFEGWYYNNEKFNFNTVITKDITLVANWKEVEKPVYNNNVTVKTRYTVTFDTQGGTSVNSQRVEKNKTVIKPSNPTKEGYTFIGWYYNDAEYNFSAKVTKNIVLTAKWEKAQETVKSEESTKPEDTTKPGDTTEPEKIKKYSVTFETDGGSSITNQEIESGKLVTKPEDPTKEGYTFIGWYYNNTKYDFATKVTKDIVLTAKWEKNAVVTYKIEETDSYVGQVILYVIKENGEKIDGLVDITTSSDKVITDVEISKAGYVTNSYKIKSISNVRAK